jgi:hypothetical protein
MKNSEDGEYKVYNLLKWAILMALLYNFASEICTHFSLCEGEDMPTTGEQKYNNLVSSRRRLLGFCSFGLIGAAGFHLNSLKSSGTITAKTYYGALCITEATVGVGLSYLLNQYEDIEVEVNARRKDQQQKSKTCADDSFPKLDRRIHNPPKLEYPLNWYEKPTPKVLERRYTPFPKKPGEKTTVTVPSNVPFQGIVDEDINSDPIGPKITVTDQQGNQYILIPQPKKKDK